MIAVFLAPLYLIVCAYLFIRGIRWLEVCHGFFAKKPVRIVMIVGYVFLVFSILIAFFLPASHFRRLLKLISNYWLGTLLYLLLTVFVADILRFILKKISFPHKEKLFSRSGHAVAGGICLAVISAFTVVGIVGARVIHTTDYEVAVKKDGGKLESLNVALIADLHLGYNIGVRQMEDMVEKINVQKPDVVIVAGDIFDNEYEALEDPDRLAEVLRGIESRYGVYACYGNHDIQEPILAGFTFGKKDEKKMSDPRMDEFMEKAGFELLMDEAVLIEDSVYIYGRPDYERPGRGVDKRKTPAELTESMDLSKPILVVDHEPRELSELADAGVDVDLCGHTHDGQMFPGNLTIDLMWENAYGYIKKGDMHNIVTSGIGVFGPNMRVGTKSEICNVKIDFE